MRTTVEFGRLPDLRKRSRRPRILCWSGRAIQRRKQRRRNTPGFSSETHAQTLLVDAHGRRLGRQKFNDCDEFVQPVRHEGLRTTSAWHEREFQW